MFRLTRRRIFIGLSALVGATLVYILSDPWNAAIKSRTRPEWLTQELYPFQDRWIEIDGHSVHYIDEGEGPTLLFLHGNPTWSFLYRDIIRRLSTEFRCIAVDYPGFGLSIAREGYGFTPREHLAVVEKLFLRLDLHDVTFIVHDWGGPIGLGLAARQSERVKALVITNTWAWPAQSDARLRRFSTLAGGFIGRFLIRYFNAFVNVVLPIGTASSLSSEEMNAYRRPFPTRSSRKPVEILPKEINASQAYLAEVERGLSRLSGKPTLIIWGAKDFAFQKRHRIHFERLFPNHRIVILTNARHFIQEDEPERISVEIRRVAGAISSGPRSPRGAMERPSRR